MPAMTEVIKPNALATCLTDTPPIYTPLSSPTLLPGQYTTILQLIE